MAREKDLVIPVSERIGSVSGVLVRPEGARSLLVLAHGAGAGMRHAFLEQVAARLAGRRVATLRYQFPDLERGAKRPDYSCARCGRPWTRRRSMRPTCPGSREGSRWVVG
jgi:hypothetical protein